MIALIPHAKALKNRITSVRRLGEAGTLRQKCRPNHYPGGVFNLSIPDQSLILNSIRIVYVLFEFSMTSNLPPIC